jgi:hypothetical protein
MSKNQRKTMAELKAEQGASADVDTVESAEGLDSARPDNEPEAEAETPETPQAEPEATTECLDSARPDNGADAALPTSTPVATAEMVSISATELQALRADAAEWNAKKASYAVLSDWHANMKNAGVTPGADAAENAGTTTKYQSKGMALARKKAGIA